MKLEIKHGLLLPLALLGLVVAFSAHAAKGGKGGGGGGGGPTDRPGDVSVCAGFLDAAADVLQSDGQGPYCDEVDGAWLISGMNGNFVAGAFGSKKFNKSKREVLFKSDCGGIVDPACDPVDGIAIAGIWTAFEYDSGLNPVGDDRLKWREMASGEVTRVAVHVNLGNSSFRFGVPGAEQIACTTDAAGTAPAWIACNGVDGDGACDDWTLSSYDLSGGSDDALACLRRDGYPDATISAPFTVDLLAVPD